MLAVLVLSGWASAAPAAESRASRRTIDVELGKEFRLEKGEAARISGTRAVLRIERFIDSPCPKGAQCGWSGQAVVPKLTINGKAAPTAPKDAPYDVEVKDTDFRSYAVFVVDEPERACARIPEKARGECLRSLARRREAPRHCRAISNERTRGFCLEDLAEALREDALCRDVAAPSQYCLYVRSKAAGELAACDAIVLFTWRARCFKELSTEGGGGPGSCAGLEPGLAKRCRELAEGPER
ncbi:MAG: hypothetical protein HY554_09395 [Elusimicrobia bacterium]|nr:hypothetical protein [Elusimicrobiota bacterium]